MFFKLYLNILFIVNQLIETKRILSGQDGISKANDAHQKLVQVNTTLSQIISNKQVGPPGDVGIKGAEGSKGEPGEKGIKGIQGARGKLW